MILKQSRRSVFNRLIWFHLPLLMYAGVILYLSSLPSTKLPVDLSGGLDKVAHLIEYGLFAAIIFRSFHDLLGTRSLRLVVLSGSFFILIFAALDELFQGSIPGRHQDPLDLAVDFVSGLIILVLLGLRARRRQPEPSAN